MQVEYKRVKFKTIDDQLAGIEVKNDRKRLRQ